MDQSDEEALAEAIHVFVDNELRTEIFTEKLVDYISDIRANAYKEGYAAARAFYKGAKE